MVKTSYSKGKGTVYNTCVQNQDFCNTIITYCIVHVYCYSQRSIPGGWKKETNAFGVTLYINTKTNEKVQLLHEKCWYANEWWVCKIDYNFIVKHGHTMIYMFLRLMICHIQMIVCCVYWGLYIWLLYYPVLWWKTISCSMRCWVEMVNMQAICFIAIMTL